VINCKFVAKLTSKKEDYKQHATVKEEKHVKNYLETFYSELILTNMRIENTVE
jgi:hypothetical protein